MIRPGDNYRKNGKRRAQVSAITPKHAVMYWPDRDIQTYVKLERFGRTKEWIKAGDTLRLPDAGIEFEITHVADDGTATMQRRGEGPR